MGASVLLVYVASQAWPVLSCVKRYVLCLDSGPYGGAHKMSCRQASTQIIYHGLQVGTVVGRSSWDGVASACLWTQRLIPANLEEC